MAIEVNYLMRCCGIKEINGLSHYTNAKSALLAFCGVLYPNEKENTAKWNKAYEIESKAGDDAYIGRYTGGMVTGAVYENFEQYSKFRFAIFTEAIHPVHHGEGRKGWAYQYGQMFAKFIQDNKLGSLVTTENHELNPNSGSLVKVWVWGIDHDALKAWYAKENPSWAQKPMSDVIASAAPAVSVFGSQPLGSGTTVVSAGSGPTLNNGSTTLASAAQAFWNSRNSL
jgi:hypothetical protein